MGQMTASEMPERYNVSTILDANLEAGRGAKAAIVGEYGEVSYERLLAMACAAGRALQALGVQREQRVLMVMDDTPAFPAVFWAPSGPGWSRSRSTRCSRPRTTNISSPTARPGWWWPTPTCCPRSPRR